MRLLVRISMVLLLGSAAMLGGCQRALFPSDAARTQFHNHQMMRGRVPPLTEPDVFGNPQPALRARLSQQP